MWLFASVTSFFFYFLSFSMIQLRWIVSSWLIIITPYIKMEHSFFDQRGSYVRVEFCSFFLWTKWRWVSERDQLFEEKEKVFLCCSLNKIHQNTEKSFKVKSYISQVVMIHESFCENIEIEITKKKFSQRKRTYGELHFQSQWQISYHYQELFENIGHQKKKTSSVQINKFHCLESLWGQL